MQTIRIQRRRVVRRGLAVLAVPALLFGIGRAVPLLSAAAQRLSEMKVGTEAAPSETAIAQTAGLLPGIPVSSGYGPIEEEPDDDPAGTPPQTTAAPAEPAAPSQTVPIDPNNPVPYPKTWQTGTGTITKLSMGASAGSQFFRLDKTGYVRNCTSHSNAELLAESRKAPAFTIAAGTAPQVLIMHSHTTESFEPFARDHYDGSFSYRTTENDKNVVLVGERVAAELRAAGIGVIHDTTVHDYPSYNGSYGRSAVTVKKQLAANPSICVVLDIHRDALTKNGALLQPVAEINGKEAAQVMVISGCDDGTMNMPHYLQNFRFASRIQQQLEGDYPGLTRPVLFDYRKYNQDLTTGSLLLEIGAHGNTIEQASYSGTLVGKSLAKTLLALRA